MSEASAGDPDRVTALGESELIELRVKGSRFLARVHPTPDRESLDRALARERAEFPDATHHCYGARLLTEERSDDDGEPGGTAGPPILRAVEARGVRGVACVVIRYYGGTKLGTGGLIRAYGDAAREALAVAPTSVVWRTTTVRVEVDLLSPPPSTTTPDAEVQPAPQVQDAPLTPPSSTTAPTSTSSPETPATTWNDSMIVSGDSVRLSARTDV